MLGRLYLVKIGCGKGVVHGGVRIDVNPRLTMLPGPRV